MENYTIGMPMQLSNKKAIITGASRGIGRELAFALAKSGCDLILTALEADELETMIKDLKAQFTVTVESVPADLTNQSDRQNLVQLIRNNDFRPNILINNAGIGFFGQFVSSSKSDILKTIELNIVATVLLTREFISLRNTNREAKIVNISSAISRLPYTGMAVYGGTKGFISSYSESLIGEFKGTNISVLCFHPGFTNSDFITSAKMDISKIPRFLFHSPEFVAAKIVNAIRKDKTWAYSDLISRFANQYASCLHNRLKTKIFKSIYWELPNEK